MAEECNLRHALGVEGVSCDAESCVFWRAVEHLDIAPAERVGCALEYFELLEDGEEVAGWLLSLKRRLEERP